MKQLQELQKHQQFPELADGRQQNYLNQQSENFITANTSFMPRGASAAVHGFQNGIFSQPQTQDLFLTLPPEQLVESLSRTRTGNNYNQYSHLQGISSDSAIAFTTGSNNQAEKPTMQSLYGRPFLGINQNISPDMHSFTDAAFQSKQLPSGKNLFGQGHNEGFQEMNTSAEEFNSRQEQTSSSEQFQGKTTNRDLSPGSATLDPLEQKILFNMDGNSWSSSFGSNTEGYTSTLECSDYLSSFPSIQSGSWSALMQSAVAESSSDDGVVQEEWSGLSFQITDNQPSNNADVGNQQNDWVNYNIPSPLNGKPQALFNGTNMSLGFSGSPFPNKQREGTRSDSSHESVQQSPKVAAKWLDGNSQQGQPVKGSQLNHAIQSPLGNAFPFQGFQLSDGNADQRSVFAKSHDQTSTLPSFGSSIQGNQNVTSAAGPVYARNQHQQQYPSAATVEPQSSQVTLPNMANKHPPFDLFIPRGTSQSSFSLDKVGGQQFSILETVPAESSRKPPSLWPNASSQTRPSGSGPAELSSDWQLSSDLTNPNPQAPSWVAQDKHGQMPSEANSSREPGADLTNPQGVFYGEEHYDKMSAQQRTLSEGVGQTTTQTGFYHGLESVAKHLSEETGFGSDTLMGNPHQVKFESAHSGEKPVLSVSATDLEVFGRSLKPSNLHPNYSCSSEIKHELGSVTGPNTSMFMNPYAFRDVNIQSTKPPSLPLLQNSAEEMGTQGLGFSHTDHNASDLAFHKTDPSQVNMQMASWFKQYGALRNGQMLSMYDKTVKNSMPPSPLGKHLENMEMRTSSVSLDVTDDNQDVKISPPSTLPPVYGNTSLSMTTSRKRKTATSDLLPWRTEVTGSSKRHQSISMAEMEWAKAVNRLTDKVDYEANMIEGVHPLLRPKKRLVLTTQLMQLVFMPAPAAFLRAKATLDYDSVAYYSAKLALGDAFNLNSWSRIGFGLPCASDNMMIEESKAIEQTSKKRYTTILESFTSRAEKLEANLLRSDKTASVVDVIVEYKELEKFSIINRFAKFHVRGPPKEAETCTPSGSSSSLPKPAPQRYVVALRARALPEKAQCLAL